MQRINAFPVASISVSKFQLFFGWLVISFCFGQNRFCKVFKTYLSLCFLFLIALFISKFLLFLVRSYFLLTGTWQRQGGNYKVFVALAASYLAIFILSRIELQSLWS